MKEIGICVILIEGVQHRGMVDAIPLFFVTSCYLDRYTFCVFIDYDTAGHD